MLENDETLTKNTIIGQANIISELSEQLKDTQTELKEIKSIKTKAEIRNSNLKSRLEKLYHLCDMSDSLRANIKSILDEATKPL